MQERRADRIRFDLDPRRRGIPSLPAFGRYNYARAMPGLPPHRHSGAIEICFLVRGRQVYEVGGRRYCLRGGDLFLTFPGEVHGTGREPEDKGLLYWLDVLDPSLTSGSLLGLPGPASRTLWSALTAIRRGGSRQFPASPDVKLHLDALAQMVRGPLTPLARVEVVNRFTSFLLAVVASHRMAARLNGQSSLDPVMREIHANLDDPDRLTVDCLASLARLSCSRFQAKFKEETGLPPAEFVLRARVAEAVRRLKLPGATVTDVAFDLGFSSSQYFAVVIRRFTNRRPSEFLR